jgi:hypothetical protein
MERPVASPLVRMLLSAVATGCAAGLISGMVLAHSNPGLNELLLAEHSGGRLAFLLVSMQAGTALSVIISLALDRA